LTAKDHRPGALADFDLDESLQDLNLLNGQGREYEMLSPALELVERPALREREGSATKPANREKNTTYHLLMLDRTERRLFALAAPTRRRGSAELAGRGRKAHLVG
jgi:hypothetical protein